MSSKFNEVLIKNDRTSIEATINTVICQLPYSYVHVVYWTIQIMLTSLSIETGVNLAVFTFARENGTFA
jgi:hypothetical protein